MWETVTNPLTGHLMEGDTIGETVRNPTINHLRQVTKWGNVQFSEDVKGMFSCSEMKSA